MAIAKQIRNRKGPRGATTARPLAVERSTGTDTRPLPWGPVLAAARRQLDQFVALEPKVLKGNKPEAIHDIRVASRRLQQVLDLLDPPPRPAKVRKLRGTIRRARRVLSDLRNCDVLLDRVERVLSRKRASRREAWEAFRDYLQERREQSFRKASRELSKRNLSSLYVRLRDHLKLAGQPSARLAPQAAPAVIPIGERDNLLRTRLDASLRETWSSLETLIARARETREVTALHAVRIGAKKVRYLVEVIHELDVPGSDQALAVLRQLQEHLGDWHDLQVLEETMLEMVARPRFLQEHLELAMEMERLALRNRQHKRIHEERLFQMTGSSEEWARLAEWVEGFLSEMPAAGAAEELHSPALPLKA